MNVQLQQNQYVEACFEPCQTSMIKFKVPSSLFIGFEIRLWTTTNVLKVNNKDTKMWPSDVDVFIANLETIFHC